MSRLTDQTLPATLTAWAGLQEYNSIVEIVLQRYDQHSRQYVLPVQLSEDIGDGLIPAPTMVLHRRTVQDLIDRLWEQGIRPTQSKESPIGNVYMGAHLHDLQKLLGLKP